MSLQINDKWIIIEPEQTKLIPSNINMVEALFDGLYYVTEGIIDITSDVVGITKRVFWIWWQNNPQIHAYFRLSPPSPPPLPLFHHPCILMGEDAAPEYIEPIIRD